MNTNNTDILTSSKAIAAYAKDKGLINMAQRYPEQEVNPELSEMLKRNILPYANEPSPQFGFLELRNAISNKTSRLYDYKYDANSEVSIVAGVKLAVFATIVSLLKEGDEVIILEPAHQSYEAAIKIAGASPVFVSLKSPDFRIEWEEVQMRITNKTRMVIINSPHYPTGSTLSELDMIRLQKILQGTKTILLSDESFEHVVFDGEMHQSVALYPFLRERSVIVSSFNETLNIQNWRLGYCMAPAHMMKDIRKLLSIMGEGINLPYQMALAEFMNSNPDFSTITAFYQKKRDLFLGIIEDSKVKAIPSKGTYFQLISIDAQGDKTDTELMHKLIDELGIAAVPICFYYHQNSKKRYLRINLSLPDEVLVEAANRLKNLK